MIKISALLLVPAFSIAMDGASLHQHTVLGEKGSPCLSISTQQLHAIKGEQELHMQGTLKAIVVRPETNKRIMLPSAVVTKRGITGDKGPFPQFPHPYLAAISLMRADVSAALGGAQVPGDNLHVEGMSLAIDKLVPGDLVVISEPNDKEKAKVIFLLTDAPHTACSRFEARTGAEAFNFINGMGKYEQETLTNVNGYTLNGPKQRLRGAFLTVLQEGVISLEDMIFAESGQCAHERIAQLGLLEFCAKALADSKEIVEKFKPKEDIVRNARRSAYQREKAASLSK